MTHNTSHTIRLQINALKVEHYYNLSFEFDYKVLSERENKIHFVGANTPRSRMTPCPRDADLMMAHAERERESAPAKQQQSKASATKAQQDLPVNVVINSRLLVCKASWDELYTMPNPL
jgi:hypothetical protein